MAAFPPPPKKCFLCSPKNWKAPNRGLSINAVYLALLEDYTFNPGDQIEVQLFTQNVVFELPAEQYRHPIPGPFGTWSFHPSSIRLNVDPTLVGELCLCDIRINTGRWRSQFFKLRENPHKIPLPPQSHAQLQPPTAPTPTQTPPSTSTPIASTSTEPPPISPLRNSPPGYSGEFSGTSFPRDPFLNCHSEPEELDPYEFGEKIIASDSESEERSSKRQRRRDIAYWYPVDNVSEKPQPGDVVAIRDHCVSKFVDGPSILSIVPFDFMPWAIRGRPESQEEASKGVLVSLLGEVEAKVKGVVVLKPDADHFILRSGENDGFAIIKSAEEMTAADSIGKVGKVVRAGLIRIEDEISFVPVLININDAAVGTHAILKELNMLRDYVDSLKITNQFASQPPSETHHVFGDSATLDKKFISRSDEQYTMISDRIFQASSHPSASSSTSTQNTPVTIIFGMPGIGKSTLAKEFCEKAKLSPNLFDQVGYFDLRWRGDNNIPERIFTSFFSHFTGYAGPLLDTSLSLPSNALHHRVFLVIDDCDDWRVVLPFLKLGPESHILVTTQLDDLGFGDLPGVMCIPLDYMNDLDAIALICKHTSDCPDQYQQKILEYAQRIPLAISLLTGIFIEDGSSSIDALLSGENSSILFSLGKFIEHSISKIGSREEIDLFCALVHFRHWNPLPASFVIDCWGWLAEHAGYSWSETLGRQLLDTLQRRSLISVTEYYDEIPLPLCSLIYPDRLMVVSLHNMIWDYCTNNLPAVFKARSKIQAVISDHFAETALSGKYNFLSMFAPAPPTDPALQFLFRAHSTCSHLNDPEMGFYEAAYLFDGSLQQIPIYLFTHQEDLQVIRTWVVQCLRTHILIPAPPPASLFSLPGKPTLNPKLFNIRSHLFGLGSNLISDNGFFVSCLCTLWAQGALKWFLRFQGSELTEIQQLLEELLTCPGFYTSPAVVLLGSFSVSPLLVAQIIAHLENNRKTLDDLCKCPYILVRLLCALPKEVNLPSFFNSIVERLIETTHSLSNYELLPNSQTLNQYYTSEALQSLIETANESGQLSDPKMLTKIHEVHQEFFAGNTSAYHEVIMHNKSLDETDELEAKAWAPYLCCIGEGPASSEVGSSAQPNVEDTAQPNQGHFPGSSLSASSRILVCFEGLAYFFQDLHSQFQNDSRSIFDLQPLLDRFLSLNPDSINSDFLTLENALHLFEENRATYGNTTLRAFHSLHQQYGTEEHQTRRPSLKSFSNKASLFYLLLPADQARIFTRLAKLQFHCGGVIRCVDVAAVEHLWPDQTCQAWPDDPSESRWFLPLSKLGDEVYFGFSSTHSDQLDLYFLNGPSAPILPNWSISFSPNVYGFLRATTNLNDLPRVQHPSSSTSVPLNPKTNLKLALNPHSGRFRKFHIPANLVLDLFSVASHVPGKHYPIYSTGFDFSYRLETGKIKYGVSKLTGFAGKRKVGIDFDWIDTAIRELSEELFFEPDPSQLPPLIELKGFLKEVFLSSLQPESAAALEWLVARGFRRISFRTPNSRYFAYSRGLVVLLHFDMELFRHWLLDYPSTKTVAEKFQPIQEPDRTYIPIKLSELQWMNDEKQMKQQRGPALHNDGIFCPDVAAKLQKDGTHWFEIYQCYRPNETPPGTSSEISLPIFTASYPAVFYYSEKRLIPKADPFDEKKSALKLLDSWGLREPWLRHVFPGVKNIQISGISAIVEFANADAALKARDRFFDNPDHGEIHCQLVVPKLRRGKDGHNSPASNQRGQPRGGKKTQQRGRTSGPSSSRGR